MPGAIQRGLYSKDLGRPLRCKQPSFSQMPTMIRFPLIDAFGLYRYLVEIGTINDNLPAISPAEPIIGDVDAAQLISTPVPGAILYEVEIGDWVKKEQRLATVLSEPAMTHHEIHSPFDGQVMTRREVHFRASRG
jgi:predicted deacylase